MAGNPESIQKMLVAGDLAKLSADDRYEYYRQVCESIGLNPLTQPFEYITLNGKLRLYAKKDATDQLRRIYGVSVDNLEHDYREVLGLYIVTVNGSLGNRKDTSTGAVNVKGLTGDALANAIMKAEAKAKRRLTLSLCGLGMLDETEVETIRSDEPPPDDPEIVLEVPPKREAKIESTDIPNSDVPVPDGEQGQVLAKKEDIIIWAKKLKALGVQKEQLLKYVERTYKVSKTTELTIGQLNEIVQKCLESREKGLDALNTMLNSE